ncbi:hypothetical protein PR048_011877 [Dryococelus australis]|uniref:Uncharacterized protein n=1 Tax=Dryococelus australis TaxID=614101 RepID=A0ABQ9HMV9_9NEOP|nr:hypothetical protein PR048_011877 [Dryococelus australis]
MLGRVIGCTKFDHYINSQDVKKASFKVPPRLQRLIVKLQPYTIYPNHVPGKHIHIADTHSRSATCKDKYFTEME